MDRLGYHCVALDPGTDPTWVSGIDVAFIALHGKYGEDGTIQAFLEGKKIPYTGSRVSASVLGMNKLATKQFLSAYHYPMPDYYVSTSPLKTLPSSFMFPVILKPVDGGSSVDVFVADSEDELRQFSAMLHRIYGTFLLESFIDGKEITVGVLEMPDPVALPVLELRPCNRFYDYDAKYTPGATEFVIPAEISEKETLAIQALAKQAHTLLGCRGMSRVDMIVHPDQGPKLLEVNTVPGLTNTSDLPAQARAYGIKFDDLVSWILSSAL